MSAETCIFPELDCSGFWRLQSTEPALVKKLRSYARDKSSPWTVAGTPVNNKSPWIFRRSFTASKNAKISLDRILMRLDAEDFELTPLTQGKGWLVKRLSGSGKSSKVGALPVPETKQYTKSMGGNNE